MHSFFLYLKKTQKEFRMTDSSFPFLKYKRNYEYLFLSLWRKQNWKLNFCLHSPCSLIPRLSPAREWGLGTRLPSRPLTSRFSLPRGGEGGLGDLVTQCDITWTDSRQINAKLMLENHPPRLPVSTRDVTSCTACDKISQTPFSPFM